jgi:HSP20 family protein
MVLNTRTLVRDPARDVVNVGNRIGRLLTEALNALEWAGRDSVRAAWVPPVDILEQDDAIRILAELPGVRPEDVQLSVEGNVLTIHGQKREPTGERAERVHRSERLYGEFERTFTLPASVDAARITAAYHAGVLTVTLPKAEHARPRRIPIAASPARERLAA